MNSTRSKFSEFVFNAQPDFNEPEMRKAFANAVPLETVVIYCFDPRVRDIPNAVASYFGDEVYPGDVLLSETGNRVGSTTTLMSVSVAGGRAIDGLRSVTVVEHLFGVKNVVVVHHSCCGASSYTVDGMIDAFRHEHGADISSAYERDSVAITDYEQSLGHDVALLRSSPGIPKHINLFGLFYNTDTGAITEVVRDTGIQGNH